MNRINLLARACAAGLPLLLGACGGERTEPADHRTLPAETAECSHAVAGAGFVNAAIDYEGNNFSAEFEATPDSAGIDAVLGFADGPADAFSDLAVAVRFNPDGFIDARDGDTYRADPGPALTYQPGVTYRFRVSVFLGARRYSASVTRPDGISYQLASDFAFRSAQQGALELTHRVAIVDSPAGTVSVCNYAKTSGDVCTRIDAGDGWQNLTSWPSPGAASFFAELKPTEANLDAVVGLAGGPADAFNDLAAIVRFNAAGTVDARNGAAYAALASLVYQPGTVYPVHVALDVREKRYSARVAGVEIARDFAFRSEQSNVPALSTSATFVDSASGGVILCNPRFASADRAIYSVPSQAGQLALGTNGRLYETSPFAGLPGSVVVRDTRSGAVLSSAQRQGRGRTDAEGNLYLAGTFEDHHDPGSGPLTSAGGRDVFVAKYTPELVPVWGRALGVAADDALTDVAIDGLGRVIVFGPGVGTVVLDGAGNTLRQSDELPAAVAANRAGELAVAGLRAGEGGPEIWVERRDPNGHTLWQNRYATREVSRIALSETGEVVFTGNFHGIVNFGGGDLRWTTTSSEAPSMAGYLVKLGPGGQHVWSLQNDFYAWLSDVHVDRAGDVVLAGTGGNQIYYAAVIKYAGGNGAELWHQSAEPERSTTQSMVVDEVGAVYWSMTLADYGPDTFTPLLQKLAP
jgi:hypothetical protein